MNITDENYFGFADGVLDGEIARIKAAQEPSKHDKEDLISYAKHVVVLRDRIQELEAGIREVIEGGYTMPHEKIWRQDGVKSKHDRCPHGNWMYDGCENCISDFLLSVLDGSKP